MVGFEITKDEFQTLAGMPLGLMFEKVLPNDKKSLSAECEKLYKKYYIDEEHFADETVLFKGVKETIYKFKNDGFYMAVASSKPKRILDKMISTFDLEGFSYVLGTEESSFKHKPDPEIVNYIMGHIVIHFDNDIAGRNATKALIIALNNRYNIYDIPAPYGKDINDYLCYILGLKNRNKIEEYKKYLVQKNVL